MHAVWKINKYRPHLSGPVQESLFNTHTSIPHIIENVLFLCTWHTRLKVGIIYQNTVQVPINGLVPNLTHIQQKSKCVAKSHAHKL